jgi:HK97 gp10 family phage protein
VFLTSYARYTPRVDGRFVTALVDEAVTSAITQWAERVLQTAQAIVPVDTGELRDSGRVVVQDKYAAVEFTSDHAVYVEYGTGRRGAASPGAGPGPYNPNWPGMKAQPYLRPAFEEHREEAPQMAAEFIGAGLK